MTLVKVTDLSVFELQLQLLESKLTKVEHDLEINKNVIRNIRKEISDLLKRGPEGIDRLKELFGVGASITKLVW